MFHLFIFFVVLLIFLHIRKHRLTSNDMEVLIFNGNKNDLEIMCDLKQPILFQIHSENEKLFSNCNYDSLEKKNYDMELIKEHGLLSFFETNFLRPHSFSYPTYSIIMTSTEYLYHISFRQYFLVTQGSATIELVPPKHVKMKNDYYEMKFSCDDIESEQKIPVSLKQGDCLFVPSLWGYKIILEESSILSFNYKTPMNAISYTDYYTMHFLQKMNTTYKVSQKIESVLSQTEEKKDD